MMYGNNNFTGGQDSSLIHLKAQRQSHLEAELSKKSHARSSIGKQFNDEVMSPTSISNKQLDVNYGSPSRQRDLDTVAQLNKRFAGQMLQKSTGYHMGSAKNAKNVTAAK